MANAKKTAAYNAANTVMNRLSGLGVTIPHGQALEVVAALAGFRYWHAYAASLVKESPDLDGQRTAEAKAEWGGLYNEQGWSESTCVNILESFIDEAGLFPKLVEFAQEVADTENGVESSDDTLIQVDDSAVAEWVGQHYGKHFESLSVAQQKDYRQQFLYTQRTLVAEEELSAYNFVDCTVLGVASSCWGMDGDDLITTVNISYEALDGSGIEVVHDRVSFHVRFTPGTVATEEAYGLLMSNGAEIGERGDACEFCGQRCNNQCDEALAQD